MIRINLLASDRARGKKRASPFALFGTVGQRMTVGCCAVLVLAGALVGWRYWSLHKESRNLDQQIAAAQQESSRLHSIILQVQQFEQRKAQLQQRVALIEELRKGQTGPVHMLDQISRALPPMLWLTELKQIGTDVVIDGKCTTLTGLSDFVANLEGTGYFKRSIEIVSTLTETMSPPPGELIKFSVKAALQSAPGAAVSGKTGGSSAAGSTVGSGRSGD
jgi:type IV pilus assembly protein PilN